ncbi:hypothetical protein QVD99_007699 [Batrachochytrium dendrobatidis]|nr:hypothetical protein QVD99_007699 [Batrachochytrium dendrobatidis]
MRLTDILLALTLVITSSMAVVPPSKTIQTPQSSQSSRCQPGSSNECIFFDQVKADYEKLKKQVKDAKKSKHLWCSSYDKLKNGIASHKAIGRPGLTSGVAKLVPNPIKSRFGKVPDGVADVEFELLDRCLKAKGIYDELLKKLQKFKETHGIGFMAKLHKFKKQFKN